MRSLWSRLLVLYAGLFFVLFAGIGVTSKQVDSAYLRARYSQNLLNGDGFVYNPDDHTLLTSAPLVVLGYATYMLPKGEVAYPPISFFLITFFVALHFLIRLFIRHGVRLSSAVLLALLTAVPLFARFGGLETYLLALSLIAVDLAHRERWQWAGLVAGLSILVSPLALIFVLLLGIKSQKTYWQLIWIPAVLWYGFAFLYFGGEGLQGLTLPSTEGEGFLGVYPLLVLLPLAFWIVTSLRSLPFYPLILVIWGLTYSFAGVLFHLTDDAILLVLSAVLMAGFAIRQNVGANGGFPLPKSYIPAIYIATLALLIVLLQPVISRNIDEESITYPDLNGSKGHYGDNREAFELGGTVYQLDGERDPHLHELVEQGDDVAAILATAPDYLLTDNMPDDSILELLNYEPVEDGIFERGQDVFEWGEVQEVNIAFGSELILKSITQDRTSIEDAGIVRLRLEWEHTSNYPPIDDLVFVFNLLDYQSASYGSARQSYPPEKWDGKLITTYHAIPVNADTPLGQYRVLLTLGYQAGTIDEEMITTVKIPVLQKPVFEQTPIAIFDDGLQVVGLLDATLNKSADRLEINVTWQAASRFKNNYSVFIHLTPLDDPIPLVQGDAFPLNGRYPTSIWEAGDLIQDTYTLDLTGLPPDKYVIRVGFFNSERGRIPLKVGGDSFVIGEITK